MNKENNTLMVEPTEAETVKRIFDLYEEGLGQVAISHVLEEEKRANIYGEVKWDVGAIRYILTNEKYKRVRPYAKRHICPRNKTEE